MDSNGRQSYGKTRRGERAASPGCLPGRHRPQLPVYQFPRIRGTGNHLASLKKQGFVLKEWPDLSTFWAFGIVSESLLAAKRIQSFEKPFAL